MKERPILFTTHMVRAILDDRKTQTRRAINPQPKEALVGIEWNDHKQIGTKCPFGQPGDRLWVRENWRIGAWNIDEGTIAIDYLADSHCRKEWLQADKDFADDTFERLWMQSTQDCIKAGLKMDDSDTYRWEPGQSPCRIRPSIHMPRWASRINLEITNVRVERLQDISEEDAKAEGTTPSIVGDDFDHIQYRAGFQTLWESIYGPGSWDANPWVWVPEFKMVKP